MGERMCYYHRIRLSKECPEDYGSFISDGMQQAHSNIPWLARNNTFSATLNQVSFCSAYNAYPYGG